MLAVSVVIPLLRFKENPSTRIEGNLQATEQYGLLFYSTAEIRMEWCIETNCDEGYF